MNESILKLSEIAEHVYFWIITIGGGAILLVWRLVASKRCQYVSLSDFVDRRFGRGEELLARTAKVLSCVVVDDKPGDFPLEFLRGLFASVSVETSVSLNDAARLSNFDVIFLDVAGVVVEDMFRGGAILIDRIRSFRKAGIIVSVSSKKYDVGVTDYFANADIRLRKPVQAASVQQQIMAHLRNEAGLAARARIIDERFGRNGIRKLRKKLICALSSGSGEDAGEIPEAIISAGIVEQFRELKRLVFRLSQ